MIPKIIHACWLGDKPLPENECRYIETWKKYNPDYQIILWTDETFSKYYDDSLFVQDCLKKKKYGFLSDYFRFTILYEFGGIYIDTDIELFKNFDRFLNNKMFMGFIFDSSIGTALFGTEPNNPLMLEWLNILKSDYEKRKAFTVSNDWITKYFIDNFSDFLLNGKEQELNCGIHIYPKDYFERYQINKKSGGGYAEHHCFGSWNDEKPTIKNKIKKFIPRKLRSYLGHKKILKETPYYNIYLRDKKK